MFEGVVGHERERRALSLTLERWRSGRGSLHHAYLFAGREEPPRDEAGAERPAGQGQWRLALEMGAALVSGGEEGPEYERAVEVLHPNLHVIAREGEQIRVDQLDELFHDLGLRSFDARPRVWIIDEADTLHPAAANRLLKSLEEPPQNVFFLLVTAEAERVLPTIVSRCHLVELGPVGAGDVLAYLRRRYALSPETAEALAELSQGSVSRAERLAAEALDGRRGQRVSAALRALRGERAAREEFVEALAARRQKLQDEASDRLQAELARLEADIPDERERAWRRRRAEDWSRRNAARMGRREALDALDTLTAVLRDLWVVSSGVSGVLWNKDHAAEVRAAVAVPPAGYERMLAAAAAVRKDLHMNVDPALALRALFCRIEEVARTCAR